MTSLNLPNIRAASLGFFVALSAPLAFAQTAPTEPAPAQEGADVETTSPPLCAQDPAEDAAKAPDDTTPAPVPEDCVAQTPAGLGDTADPGEMRASMRRFVPSEQISEDSSVAFPNDI